MLETCFLTKRCIFSPKSQNAQHVRTCIIWIWIQEVKYLKITKIFSAYAKTMCWWDSSRLFSAQSVMVHVQQQ